MYSQLGAEDSSRSSGGRFQEYLNSESTLPLLFATISGLAAFSCLARADYNLPLFVLLYFVLFELSSDKKRKIVDWFFWIVLFSCLQDFVWLCFWSAQWFSDEWRAIDKSASSIHIIVVLCSTVELLLKLVVVYIFQNMGANYQALIDIPTKIYLKLSQGTNNADHEEHFDRYQQGPMANRA